MSRSSEVRSGADSRNLMMSNHEKARNPILDEGSEEFFFKHVLGDVYMAQSQRNMLLDTVPAHIQEHDAKTKKFPVHTKIICTIGPNTSSCDQLHKMLMAGMNVARLNFSHGDQESHSKTIKNIKQVRKAAKRILGVVMDTRGPEIRTTDIKDCGSITLTKNTTILLRADRSVQTTAERIILNCDCALADVLSVGHRVLINNGLIKLTVTSILSASEVKCSVDSDGVLSSRKPVNLPDSTIDLPLVSVEDKRDIMFGVEQGVDFVAASFTRSARGVLIIRDLLDSMGLRGKKVKIIAKIEDQEGLDNFDSILSVVDGIMVARGNLGVEIPIEQVALAQKMMIQKCNVAGKFVITATQMLESMTVNPSPTRAEASDVSNAVLDGTDCVMLSGETACGAYPVQAVEMMVDICREIEQYIDYQSVFELMMDEQNPSLLKTVSEAVAVGAVRAAFNLHGQVILALTESGRTARLVSKYRPRSMVVAITASEMVARQCMVNFGVFPALVGSMQGSESLLRRVINTLLKLELLLPEDIVVATVGQIEGKSSSTNEMIVLKA